MSSFSCNQRWVMVTSPSPDRIWVQPMTTSPALAVVISGPGSRSWRVEQNTICNTSMLPEGTSSAAADLEAADVLETAGAVSSAPTRTTKPNETATRAAQIDFLLF